MKRTAEEAAETRRSIVRAARELFAERGYAAASTRDLVTETGVTRGALYHHFADKADLFRAVFVDLEHELDATVNAAATTAVRNGGDARAAMVAGSRAWLRFARRDDYRRIALIDAPAVLGNDAWHEIDRDVGLRSMEAGLRALDRAGELAVPSSRALAVALFGALTELGLAFARGALTERAAVAAFETVLDGITTPRVRGNGVTRPRSR